MLFRSYQKNNKKNKKDINIYMNTNIDNNKEEEEENILYNNFSVPKRKNKNQSYHFKTKEEREKEIEIGALKYLQNDYKNKSKSKSKNASKINNIQIELNKNKSKSKNNSRIDNIYINVNLDGNNNKEENKKLNTLESQVPKDQNIDNNNKSNSIRKVIPHFNSSQNKFNRLLNIDGTKRKSNSISNKKYKRPSDNTLTTEKIMHKLNDKEMLEVDAIKSKFKQKLIEMNERLSDAIFYYNGPIDISCISCSNYDDTVHELYRRVGKNGFKCIKHDKNYFRFTNGLDSFLVEIVKIRNNMLYYLIVKNQ